MNETPVPRTQFGDARIALSRWRKRVLALLWLTYASFYLCRVNLAASQKSLAAAEGYSKRQLGTLLACLKIFYASGQLINGALADRFGPRVLIVMGLVTSSGLNMVFAHLHSFRWMAATWALNGYFQACGWTSIVRTIANWFPERLRDAASGIIGTSYILGSGLSWLLAGWLTDAYGWRYAFWVPAWGCLAVTVIFVLGAKSHPRDVGLEGIDADPEPPGPAPGESCPMWRGMLTSPALWALAVANMALIYGYHGLLDWTPHYLAEVGGIAASAAAKRAFLMPLGGALGCMAVTVTTRRTGKRLGRTATAVPIVLLAIATYAFPAVAESAPVLVPVMLVLLGALSSGPASMMACSMPADIGSSAGAATAAGLVDASGYLGSVLSGWSSGRIMDHVTAARGQQAGWRAVWHVWPLGMLIAAVLVCLSSNPPPNGSSGAAECGDDE